MTKNIYKLIVTCSMIAITTSSTIVFANADANTENRTGFYIRANVGANKMNDAKEEIEDINKTLKSKSEISPMFAIGIGSYINNVIRIDFTFDYLKVDFKNGKMRLLKESGEDGNGEYTTVIVDSSIDRKASIYSGMLNTYVDLPITEKTNFFVGGGIGLAQIREKVSASAKCTIYNHEDDSTGNFSETESVSSKRKNNFAYSLTAGISTKIAANTNIELAYSWKDFGKTKHKKDKDGDKPYSNRYRGHVLTVGVRFDV